MTDCLPPVLDERTRFLVLGSFPGQRSLQVQQYYAHPQNAFWRIMAALIQLPDLPTLPYDSRLANLQAKGIGLWDVYARCDRQGSLDSAIKNAKPNDFLSLKTRCPQLKRIAHNGKESAKHAVHTAALGVEVIALPSTSPANATWSFERKLNAWQGLIA